LVVLSVLGTGITYCVHPTTLRSSWPTVAKFGIPGYSGLSFVMYELFLFQNKMMVIIDVYP